MELVTPFHPFSIPLLVLLSSLIFLHDISHTLINLRSPFECKDGSSHMGAWLERERSLLVRALRLKMIVVVVGNYSVFSMVVKVALPKQHVPIKGEL